MHPISTSVIANQVFSLVAGRILRAENKKNENENENVDINRLGFFPWFHASPHYNATFYCVVPGIVVQNS
jgi:hypothetical protein